MDRRTVVVGLAVAGLVSGLGCGGSGPETSNVAGPAVETGKSADDPCSMLTADLVRSVFDLGEAEPEFRPGMSQVHPSCVATWPVDNAEAAQAEATEVMQEYLKAKMSGKKDVGPMPLPHLEHEVRLTIAGQTYPDPAAAQAGFEALMATLEEGVTAEAEVEGQKQKHTFRVHYDHEVDGVGTRAAWAPKLKQLTFASGVRIYHVGVDLGDEAPNEAKAVELAKALIDGV